MHASTLFQITLGTLAGELPVLLTFSIGIIVAITSGALSRRARGLCIAAFAMLIPAHLIMPVISGGMPLLLRGHSFGEMRVWFILVGLLRNGAQAVVYLLLILALFPERRPPVAPPGITH